MAQSGETTKEHWDVCSEIQTGGDTYCSTKRKLLFTTPYRGQGDALRGLEVARLNLTHIIVEGDCRVAIQAATRSGPCPWEIDLLIADVLHSLSAFSEVQFTHIFREANTVADKVAELGHLLDVSLIGDYWDVCNLIRKDAIGWWSRRV